MLQIYMVPVVHVMIIHTILDVLIVQLQIMIQMLQAMMDHVY